MKKSTLTKLCQNGDTDGFNGELDGTGRTNYMGRKNCCFVL